MVNPIPGWLYLFGSGGYYIHMTISVNLDSQDSFFFLAVAWLLYVWSKVGLLTIILQNERQTHELIDIQVPTIGLP